jgi:hypothetical protein
MLVSDILSIPLRGSIFVLYIVYDIYQVQVNYHYELDTELEYAFLILYTILHKIFLSLFNAT